MQTYTHLGIGIILGKILFPDNWILQGFCAFGAIMPDIPAAIELILNKIKGVKPFAESSENFYLIEDVSHSSSLCTSYFFIAHMLFNIYFISGVIGISSHIIIDILTHNGKKFYHKTSNILLLSAFELSKYIGIWDYRYDFGVLWPKPFEAIVDAIMIVIIYNMYV